MICKTCLHPEKDELDIHVDEVGHEGYLGDGGPESPGEELIDQSAVSPDTGECDPGEHQSPAELEEALIRPFFLLVIQGVDGGVDAVRPVNKTEGGEECQGPDGEIGQRTDVDLDILGDMENVSHHQSNQVALIPEK